MRKLMATVACGLVAVALSGRVGVAADSKPDAEGFVQEWLTLGPIGNGDTSGPDALDAKQIPEEAALQPKAGDKQKVGAKELVWKAGKVKDKEFYVDLAAAYPDEKDSVTGYMVTYVFADAETKDVTVTMCSNDQGKLYMNGKEILKFAETRSTDRDGDKKEGVTLVKGRNTFVLKVVNEQNDWTGALRITGKDGKPVAGLTVKTAP
ncbi:MAG TPA: hypothetical protein VK986_17930 [Tepidisphaeraceae bacterium]|nr:hypothetical protein [Tepidisphaeraceae bacterium]